MQIVPLSIERALAWLRQGIAAYGMAVCGLMSVPDGWALVAQLVTCVDPSS